MRQASKVVPDIGRRGRGRPPGSPNKVTATLKEAILGAFDAAGGEAYLVQVAKSDPRTFCALLGKVLPKQVKLDADESLFAGMPSEERDHLRSVLETELARRSMTPKQKRARAVSLAQNLGSRPH